MIWQIVSTFPEANTKIARLQLLIIHGKLSGGDKPYS
jgi:hypothetical protein